MRVTVGRMGSSDRLILRVNRDGLYLSLRPRKTKRFFLAAGPIYDPTIGIR